MTTYIRTLLVRAAATVLAYALLFPVFIAIVTGRVTVTNYTRAYASVKRGRLLIIANHPSLVETIALPALFWWQVWVGNGRLVPWSLADSRLFRYSWLYPSFRCISVERGAGASRRDNVRALRQVLDWWNQERSIILYPEGGRTCKGESFYESGNKVVRAPDVAVVALAARHGVPVMPVWVESSTTVGPESMVRGYLRMFFQTPLRIRFGEPRLVAPQAVTPQFVADLLLGV